jgi:hypothetical protein
MRFALRLCFPGACAFAITVCWWTGAYAQVINPAEIPQRGKAGKDYVCEKEGNRFVVSRTALLDWVANDYSLRRQCARTQEDVLDLLVGEPEEATRCSEREIQAIHAARTALTSLLSDRNPAHFKVHGWGDEDRRGWRTIRYMKELKSFLGSNPRRTIECLKADQGPQMGGGGFDVSDLKIGSWKVRLRQDQNSLDSDRVKDKDAFKKAKSAQFSITDDFIADQTKYDVRATVGLDSEYQPCGHDQECRLIPYVKWEHTRTAPKAAKNDTDKTTYGVLGVHYAAFRELPISWKTTLDLQYIVDEKGPEPTEIVAGTVKWRPAFTVAPGVIVPGPARQIGSMILFGYDFGGVVRYGEALESGGNIIFDLQKTFVYAGGDIDVWFMGMKDTALERVKLQLYYSHLFAQRGIFSRLPYFSAELSYQLDKDGLFDIKITYDHGREYETFEEREVWKTSLGFKF